MSNFTLIRAGFAILGRLLPRQAAEIARRLLMTPRSYPARDKELLAETQANRRYFGEGLSALHWGEHGPIVLCVHGWEGRATQFAPYIEPLLDAGYQVVSLDAPAHGQSVGEEAHPLLFAKAVQDAAWEFGPIDMIIGHSMGAGAISIALSRGLQVRRAVLIAGPASLRAMLLRFSHFISLPERARHRFLALVEAHTGAPLDSVEISKLVPYFEMPALIVHDVEDVMMPFTEAQEVAANWPRAQLYKTSGLGHRRIIKHASVVNAVTEFAGPSSSLKEAA